MSRGGYDLLVIGGGSGGISAATTAAELGASVCLVEKDKLGGTCVNRGCVPKKLLWTAARACRAATLAGLDVSFGDTRFGALKGRIDDHIGGLRENFVGQLADAGVDLKRGTASVDADGAVQVDGNRVVADRLLLAVGAKPTVPPFEGADLMEVSDDVFTWTTLPRSLLILGGGYIGCEFATIFAALGVDVLLVTDGDQVFDGFDPDAAAIAGENLSAQGVEIVLGESAETVARTEDGLRVSLKGGRTVTVERAVCAVGRGPDLAALGGIAERLQTADTGAAAIDEAFETSVPGIHAVGDCADRLPLTPVALQDGRSLAGRLFGSGAARLDLSHVASTAFGLPPLAQVGRLSGDDVSARSNRVSPLENAVRSGAAAPDDFVKLAVNGQGGRLAGVVMLSDGAHEAIGLAALSLAAKADREAAATLAAIHPSFTEEVIDELRG